MRQCSETQPLHTPTRITSFWSMENLKEDHNDSAECCALLLKCQILHLPSFSDNLCHVEYQLESRPTAHKKSLNTLSHASSQIPVPVVVGGRYNVKCNIQPAANYIMFISKCRRVTIFEYTQLLLCEHLGTHV